MIRFLLLQKVFEIKKGYTFCVTFLAVGEGIEPPRGS
jgi:hypothetical protein